MLKCVVVPTVLKGTNKFNLLSIPLKPPLYPTGTPRRHRKIEKIDRSSWKSTYDVEWLLCESRCNIEGRRIVLGAGSQGRALCIIKRKHAVILRLQIPPKYRV